MMITWRRRPNQLKNTKIYVRICLKGNINYSLCYFEQGDFYCSFLVSSLQYERWIFSPCFMWSILCDLLKLNLENGRLVLPAGCLFLLARDTHTT